MAKRFTITVGLFLFLSLAVGLFAQEPADGENNYRLSAVNKRFLPVPDTLDSDAGRGVFVASNPDLDGDGKPEILVTEYSDGGRVLVFEVVGDDKMEYVWGSKRINPGGFGPGSTPRSVSVGDLDNDGKMEIIFQIGNNPADSLRGIHIYEYQGNDNDYGTDPAIIIPFESIDSLFGEINVGRSENPLKVQDVDGDGKNELMFTPRAFGNLDAGNMYILEVDAGTFENGDANVRVEYKYAAMAKAIDFGDDGYTPVNSVIGDVDNDGVTEIVVLGWTNTNSGAGIGFIEIQGVDTYRDGSVVPLSETSVFGVKADAQIFQANGSNFLIFAAGWSSQNIQRVYVADNIFSDDFVSASDFQIISDGVEQFGIMGIGDQDHSGDASDGFDIYVSTVNEIHDIEYKGMGLVSDPASYTNHGRIGGFNLDEVYDVSDGLFDELFTYPGMDLDKDGNREIVASYKGSGNDILQGAAFSKNTYGIFVFEFGDSTQSIPLTLTTDVKTRNAGSFTIITPEDFVLEQNYPNPFNPTTNITFDLPLDKTVSLKIYNSLGQEVRTLVNNQALSQGKHTIRWDATDNSGNAVSSGVYIYKLIFGNFSKSKQMTLVR